MIKNNDKKNFIWNIIGVSINSFNSFFYLIIANHLNGKVEAGIFTFAFSLICLFYIIGTYFGRIYQISNSDRYNNKTFLYNRIITCILMFLVILGFILFNSYSKYKIMIIIAIAIFRCIEAFSDILYGFLQQNNELYKSGISLTVKGIVGILTFAIVDYITKDLFLALIALSIVNILVIIFYDWFQSYKYFKNDKFVKSDCIKMIKDGFPVFAYNLLSIYLINVSKYTLDYFCSPEIQNIYGIILMPATVLSLCAMYLLNPFLPKMKNLYQENNLKHLDKMLNKLIIAMSTMGIIVLVIASFIGIPILNIIYSINLNEYKLAFLLIVGGAILYTVAAMYSAVLTVFHKNYVQTYIYLFGCIIETIIAIILINNFKIFGSSLTYFIIMIYLWLAYFVMYRKFLRSIGMKKNNCKSKDYKISIITVCYNSAKTISYTFDSVLSQKYENYEIIVVDGKSKDNTVEIIKKYKEIFKDKMKYVSEKDDGLYDAMNKGIKMSTGDVIGILNSDDLLCDENVLSKINDAINDKNHGIYANLIMLEDKKLKIPERKFIAGSGKYIFGFMPPHPTLYLKKEVYDKVGLYNQKYKIAADYDFIIRMYRKKEFKISYLKEFTVFMRPGGKSTNGIKGHLESIKDAYIVLKDNKVHFPIIVSILKFTRNFIKAVFAKIKQILKIK